MTTKIRSIVHPRYRGIAEWKVRGIAQLAQPMEYDDPVQGHVRYDPRVLWLRSSGHGKVLWFAYWISTNKTKGKMKWGQGPPMLEETALLELLQDAIAKKFFSRSFLKRLDLEVAHALAK